MVCKTRDSQKCRNEQIFGCKQESYQRYQSYLLKKTIVIFFFLRMRGRERETVNSTWHLLHYQNHFRFVFPAVVWLLLFSSFLRAWFYISETGKIWSQPINVTGVVEGVSRLYSPLFLSFMLNISCFWKVLQVSYNWSWRSEQKSFEVQDDSTTKEIILSVVLSHAS